MKKVLLATVLFTALSGCQTTNEAKVDWLQDNKVEVMNSHVQLSSAVWINKMPSVGEERDETKLNLALVLNSKQTLAPELKIEAVVLRQGDITWEISEEEYEIRVQSDHAWEIAGYTFQELDPNKAIDIAIQTNGQWIVEAGVMIDTVY